MEKEREHIHNTLCQYLEEILNLVPDAVYISNRQGETLRVNKHWERLTGIPVPDVMGKNVRDLVTNGVFSAVVNPDVVATRDTVTLVQEVNNRKVVLKGNPVLDEKGEVELVVTFVRDITQFERLRREIVAQRALVDSYQRQVASFNPEAVFQKDGMIAVSEASLTVLDSVDTIAPTDAAVLILGDTSVGKDVVARRIHNKSHRSEKTYLKVDCTAIPESLVESELFGYEPGSFSGARQRRKQGLFETANGGTLFLDEIGELSLSMQTKLLRAIQDQEIIRIGATEVTPIDVRIVAATNRNLEEEVRKGRFRSDLYYRLKVAVLHILPLRERKDDILPLIKVFLHRFNNKYGKNIVFSDRIENLLLRYHWPGNVRELENMVHRIVVTSTKDRLSCRDLPTEIFAKDACLDRESIIQQVDIGNRSLKEIVKHFEQNVINEAVEIYGSVSKAAKALQVDRSTLFRKAKPMENGAK